MVTDISVTFRLQFPSGDNMGSKTGKMVFPDLCYAIVDIRRLLEYYPSYSTGLQYFNFVASIITCLVGLLGNAVVICFIGFIMKKKHKSKYWFLNLAIADFSSLLILPFHAVAVHKGTWPFGHHMCKLFLFSFCVNMYASIFILSALNIARFLSVAHPMFHLKLMSQRFSFWTCFFIWFFTILSSLPVFYFGGEAKIGKVILCSYLDNEIFGNVEFNTGYNVSSENTTRDFLASDIYTNFSPFFQRCSSDTCCGGKETFQFWEHLIFTSKWFLIPFLVVGYFIPLGIVIICNITIVVHVRKSKTVNAHRLYRIVLVIVMVYFITWTPLITAYIVLLISAFNMNLIVMMNVLQFMPLLINIAYTNSCLNPVVYVLSGGRMRTGLFDFISSIRNSCK
ncbi:chemerin-like receptor 1 [Rhinoderma darwinii]|uniref:chemerin-like receptor 1 n=1 Tax=Rhinoderma darwinii TaxID=43563 RepID=UPI003F67C912